VPSGGGPTARRRPFRLLIVAVAVLVLLVAGGIATYSWALGHWFVGVHDNGQTEEVAVFRGLDASVLGLDLYEFDHDAGLAVKELTPNARTRVRGGIAATNAADADRILDNLRGSRLPLCRTEQAESTDGRSSTASSSAAATGSAASATTRRSGATSTASAGGSETAASATTTRPTKPTGSVTRPSGTAITSASTATRSTAPQVPGEDCREAK
jgi:protein phosphatase